MSYTISIHAPVWGATQQRLLAVKWTVISIHAPVWGCDISRILRASSPVHFNPRTRVGCDDIGCVRMVSRNISIHAPVLGATSALWMSSRMCPISIHAPVWGATFIDGKDEFSSFISIHAPVWGATLAVSPFWFLRLNFNPRTRVGCDVCDGAMHHAQ